jgi:hypothetical protein
VTGALVYLIPYAAAFIFLAASGWGSLKGLVAIILAEPWFTVLTTFFRRSLENSDYDDWTLPPIAIVLLLISAVINACFVGFLGILCTKPWSSAIDSSDLDRESSMVQR